MVMHISRKGISPEPTNPASSAKLKMNYLMGSLSWHELLALQLIICMGRGRNNQFELILSAGVASYSEALLSAGSLLAILSLSP